MNAIYKYPLPLAGEPFDIEMPDGARILTAQDQGGMITLWALVDTETPLASNRRLVIIGTGWKRDLSNMQYIATVQQGPYVWHLFEVTR